MFTIGHASSCVGLLAAALLLAIGGPVGLAAAEPAYRMTFLDDRTHSEQIVEARVLVEAVDGGVLAEDVEGRLWSITPDRLRSKIGTAQEFEFMDADSLGEALRAELGAGFESHKTPHYVICSDTGDAYAEWVGTLFERLQRAFLQTWRQAGWDLAEPAAPLPAVVFRTQQEFAAYALKDAGPEVADKPGYYSIRTNRIVLYDLATAGMNEGALDLGEVERRVASAPERVATIVHEATHQIAFNCGMHTRYADTPMWLAEGLAMYCETPDLKTGSGWRTIGRLNVDRLRQYREFTAQRRAGDSLQTLICDEARFRDPSRMPDAYAESWALVDYLMRDRRDELVKYMQGIAAKPRLHWEDGDTRLAEFTAVFGDLQDIEADCSRHIRRLRAR
ncbi:MAG: DUF1570 domain-containing protein [Planctomycetaceae bacterium]|nr:DUF1570 domain-containing protein [Planctomycetaceae bacterium]